MIERMFDTLPIRDRSHPSAQLLNQAAAGVVAAQREDLATRRLAAAHLAALRGATAVLAARARPSRSDRGPTDAWLLVATVAPELAEWARFFASWSPTRRTGRGVTARDADDMVRQVEQFLVLAEAAARAQQRPGSSRQAQRRPGAGG